MKSKLILGLKLVGLVALTVVTSALAGKAAFEILTDVSGKGENNA